MRIEKPRLAHNSESLSKPDATGHVSVECGILVANSGRIVDCGRRVMKIITVVVNFLNRSLMLPFRIALEMARSGCANEASARRLASLELHVRFLTEAGHGQLDVNDVRNAERALAEIFEIGR